MIIAKIPHYLLWRSRRLYQPSKLFYNISHCS